MTWRVARSLDQLLAQLNALAPNRSRASDGSIGDEAHQAQGSDSDHNPWFVLGGQPLVTARDFTHDPANGLDCDRLAAALIEAKDPRVKYLIWRGRIVDSRPQFNPWTWQPSSGHYQHLHLSVMANASADDPRPWSLPGLTSTEEDEMGVLDEPIERKGRPPITLRAFLAAADAVTDETRDVIRNNGVHAPIMRDGRQPLTVAQFVQYADDVTDETRRLIAAGKSMVVSRDDLAAALRTALPEVLPELDDAEETADAVVARLAAIFAGAPHPAQPAD